MTAAYYFDYFNESTDELGYFGENSSDKARTITFIPAKSFADEYNLEKQVVMEQIWSIPIYYPGTDLINYVIRAYSGGGIFAVMDYEHSNFGVFTERPDKADYE